MNPRRVRLANVLALLAASAAAIAGAAVGTPPAARRFVAPAPSATDLPQTIALPDGTRALVDAGGHAVPLRRFTRLVSTNLVTDRLFVELCEPNRIAAFSAAGVRSSPWRHQYAGKASVEGFGAVEPIIALRPDLVVLNSYGSSRLGSKLRDAGVTVFDLGELRGAASVMHTARTLAVLLGAPERGDRFARGFERRLRRVAAPLGTRTRVTGVFVSAIGSQMYGGTRGTNYHDILESAGIIDVAARAYIDWPQYDAEDLLALAPDVIVTKEGGAASLCTRAGLDHLAACRRAGAVLELPASLLDEPGPAILDAAEVLFAKAYPPAPP